MLDWFLLNSNNSPNLIDLIQNKENTFVLVIESVLCVYSVCVCVFMLIEFFLMILSFIEIIKFSKSNIISRSE